MTTDREEFIRWLRVQVDRAGGVRASARRAGFTHATMVRALEGEPLSLKTLEDISKWTGVGLTRLLRLYGAEIGQDERAEAAFARMLDQYPQLRDTLDTALEVLDEEDLLKVIEFIQFQAERKRK